MLPVLFQIGPLTFHTYGLLIALGILLGSRIAVQLATRDGVPRPQAEDWITGLLFYFVIGGLIGGRAAYVLNFPQEFEGDWPALFKIWQGGLVSYGGLAGALIGFAIWALRHREAPWRVTLDWLAPGIAFGHALGRLGCFAAGCCYGLPTDAPWAVIFTNPRSLAPLDIPLHPTQLYESAFLIALGFFLLRRFKKDRAAGRPRTGAIFLQYLGLYSLGRFAIEFFRGDPRPALGLTYGQFMSAGVFVLALLLWKFLTKPAGFHKIAGQ